MSHLVVTNCNKSFAKNPNSSALGRLKLMSAFLSAPYNSPAKRSFPISPTSDLEDLVQCSNQHDVCRKQSKSRDCPCNNHQLVSAASYQAELLDKVYIHHHSFDMWMSD